MNSLSNAKTGNTINFSRPRAEFYVANYFDKAGVLATIIIALMQMVFSPGAVAPIRWLYVLFIWAIWSFLVSLIFRRMAYRMTFDLDKKEVIFSLFRRERSLTVNFKDIRRIHLNIYIAFVLEKRKVFFRQSGE